MAVEAHTRGMLATALVTLLAAPGVSPEALDAILSAQAAQATRSYRARFEIVERSTGRRTASSMEVVPPDRLHFLDEGPAPTEHVQIGGKAWMRMGEKAWEPHPLPDSLAGLKGPLRADDWGWELRDARAGTSRDVGGQRCRGYEYTLASESGASTVRLWVDEATALPRRYEEDHDDSTFSWELSYEDGLAVEPPPGQAAPLSRPARPANIPRLTLPVASAGSREGDLAGRPFVVVRGGGDLRLGAERVADAEALAQRLRSAAATPLVFAGHDLPWTAVEPALDAAREAGEPAVALGVRQPSGGESFLPIGLRRDSTPAPAGVLLVARPVSGHGAQQVFELNGLQQPRPAFEQRLRDVLSVRRKPVIVDVRVGGSPDLQDVVALIDLLRGAGAEVLVTTRAAERFAPQPPPPPPPPPR